MTIDVVRSLALYPPLEGHLNLLTMILILTNEYDTSTDKVIDWITYKGGDFIRINGERFLKRESFESLLLTNSTCEVKASKFSSRQVTAIWLRKNPKSEISSMINEGTLGKNHTRIIDHLGKELADLKAFVFNQLSKNVACLGSYDLFVLNKLDILQIAKRCKIDIPATLVTNLKSELKIFLSNYQDIITKPISDVVTIYTDGNKSHCSTSTEVVTKSMFKELPTKFFPSFFQEKIEKEIELRIFFLDDEFYPMAIFSQSESQTSVDYRKYSNNRFVPYKLKKSVESKIRRLMKVIGLNTGSIDMIKTKQNRFVFLEVNPVGQYDWVSTLCNYHLDEKIADFLLKSKLSKNAAKQI